MDKSLDNELELATASVVKQAARGFASALYKSEPFQTYEKAASHLHEDSEAQEAIRAFQEKQQSLKMMLMLNAVSEEDRAELEMLHKLMFTQPSVIDFVAAQQQLKTLCQILAGRLSNKISLDYASACGASCCG